MPTMHSAAPAWGPRPAPTGSVRLTHRRRRPSPWGSILRAVLGAALVAIMGAGPTPPARARRASAPRAHARRAPQADELKRLESKLRAAQAAGKIFDALGLARRKLALVEAAHGDGAQDPALVRAVDDVARLAMAAGDYAAALRGYERALALHRAVDGPDSNAVAAALQQLAVVHWVLRDYQKAKPLLAQAMALYKDRYGEESPMYVAQLQIAASLAGARQAYSVAEDYLLQARTLAARSVAGKPPKVAAASLIGPVMSLAWNAWLAGHREVAAARFRELVELQERIYGPKSDSLATILQMVGSNWQRAGEPARAKPWFDRAEAIFRETLDRADANPNTPDTRLKLLRSGLAGLLLARGDYDAAWPLYQRLAHEAAKASGPLSTAAAGALWPLSQIARAQGRYGAAAKLLRKIAKIYRKTLGPSQVSGPLAVLGEVLRERGDFAGAEQLVRKLLKLYAKTYGPRHPLTANQWERLAILELARGRAAKAVAHLRRAYAILAPHIALAMATGTEADNRSYMEAIAYQVDIAVTANVAFAPDAADFALGVVLRRKARALDAATDSLGTLRRRATPTDRKLLDELASARAQLARLLLRGPKGGSVKEREARIQALQRTVRRLEGEARERSAAFRAQSQPVTLARVRAALPKDGALLEIVSYHPLDPRGRWGAAKVPAHYAAYVLRADGAPVAWAELGPAAAIDAKVQTLRAALSSPARTDFRQASRAVFDAVMAPVLGQLAQVRRLLVAPDGALNLVPFAALVDAEDRYLLQRFEISYLSSGRDLLRLQVHVPPRHRAEIFAAPDFGQASAPAPTSSPEPAPPEASPSQPSRGRRARGFSMTAWSPLPGTAREAQALEHVLAGAHVHTGAAATEGAIKGVEGPRLLHVATHGFFLPAPKQAAGGPPQPPGGAGAAGGAAGPGGPGLGRAGGGPAAARGENPLLRSGLIFAQANRLDSGQDDGVLTALEATGLDLWGTELVVLSACETAVGEVRVGQGVDGLRRALIIAGAESQLMSLWQVDDEATRALMTDYYKRLKRGAGRAQALRQVQLKMMRAPHTAHPFYWAAFIPAGAWTPLPAVTTPKSAGGPPATSTPQGADSPGLPASPGL